MKIRICLLIILMGLLYPGYISSQESPYVFRQIGVVEGLRLSLKPWGIALKFLFLHHENILFPND